MYLCLLSPCPFFWTICDLNFSFLPESAQARIVKRVPKGTSEYQSAWIVEDEHEEEDGDSNHESVDEMMEDELMGENKETSPDSMVGNHC